MKLKIVKNLTLLSLFLKLLFSAFLCDELNQKFAFCVCEETFSFHLSTVLSKQVIHEKGMAERAMREKAKKNNSAVNLVLLFFCGSPNQTDVDAK